MVHLHELSREIELQPLSKDDTVKSVKIKIHPVVNFMVRDLQLKTTLSLMPTILNGEDITNHNGVPLMAVPKFNFDGPYIDDKFQEVLECLGCLDPDFIKAVIPSYNRFQNQEFMAIVSGVQELVEKFDGLELSKEENTDTLNQPEFCKKFAKAFALFSPEIICLSKCELTCQGEYIIVPIFKDNGWSIFTSTNTIVNYARTYLTKAFFVDVEENQATGKPEFKYLDFHLTRYTIKKFIELLKTQNFEISPDLSLLLHNFRLSPIQGDLVKNTELTKIINE